jgi:hypothetical protein
MRSTTVLAGVLCAAFCAVASAQSLNIDVGTQNPAPAFFYAGPGNSAGQWNIYAGGVSSGLLDLAGSPTAASISGTGGFLSSFNDPLTLGDDQNLLDDYLAIPFIDTYTVSGLAAGSYDVYVTTWTFGPLSTGIDVNSLGMQIIGGTWPGNFVAGSTHSLHSVSITSGQDITIGVFSINGALGAVSGIQIVQIPAPSAGAIMLSFGMLAARRRR